MSVAPEPETPEAETESPRTEAPKTGTESPGTEAVKTEDPRTETGASTGTESPRTGASKPDAGASKTGTEIPKTQALETAAEVLRPAPETPKPVPESKPVARDNPVFGWIAVAIVVAAAAWALRPTPPRADVPAKTSPPVVPVAKVSLGVQLVRDKDTKEVKVGEVFPGGNASRSSLRAGDVLLKVDDRDVGGEQRVLLERLAALAPGAVLVLEVRRADGAVEVVRVTLSAEGDFEPGLARDLIASAVAQLVSARRADGLWPHYQEPAPGQERLPSVAVTALVAHALARVGADLSPAGREALAGARERLLAAQGRDGGLLDPAHLYPHRTYATALAAMALEGEAASKDARERMRRWLSDAQVGEAHGFDAIDNRYGGWSYYDTYAPARLRTDVSTLRFATTALTGLPDDSPVWDRARLWLDLCQNRAVLSAPDARGFEAERALRDGGFAFGPRNSKASTVPVGDALVVYTSYGSATADGALALCAVDGVDARGIPTMPALGPELAAALGWLAARWDVSGVPGFVEQRPERGWTKGVHFYYLAALSELLHRVGAWQVVGRDGKAHAWSREVVRVLGALHGQARGRFVNEVNLMHEEEPAVAGSLALLALCAARDRLALGAGGDVKAAHDAGVTVAAPAGPPRDAVERGRVVFARCAGCHQDDGLANGPSLAGLGPRLEGRHPRDPAAAAGALRAFLRDPSRPLFEDRPGVVMPPQQLGEGELDDVIRFLLTR